MAIASTRSKLAQDAAALLELRRDVPDFTFRNLLETLALIAGRKSLLRLVLDDRPMPPVRALLERIGLQVAVSPWKIAPVYSTPLGDTYTEVVENNDPRGVRRVLMAASRTTVLNQGLDLEEAGDFDHELGPLLGYPKCCVSAYDRVGPDRHWLDLLIEGNNPNGPLPCGANRLASLFDDRALFYDYFPCSLQCEATRAISRSGLELLGLCGLEEQAAAALRVMGTPILLRRGVLARLNGATVESGRLRYELSRAGLFCWRARPGAEDDAAWSTSGLEVENGRVSLFANDQRVTTFDEGPLDRVFLFDGREI